MITAFIKNASTGAQYCTLKKRLRKFHYLVIYSRFGDIFKFKIYQHF